MVKPRQNRTCIAEMLFQHEVGTWCQKSGSAIMTYGQVWKAFDAFHETDSVTRKKSHDISPLGGQKGGLKFPRCLAAAPNDPSCVNKVRQAGQGMKPVSRSGSKIRERGAIFLGGSSKTQTTEDKSHRRAEQYRSRKMP